MNYKDPNMQLFEKACAIALFNISRLLHEIETGVSGTKEIRDEVNQELDRLFDIYRDTND